MQHQDSRGDSRGGGRGNSRGDSANNNRGGSGRKVDLSNADDTPILEPRSKYFKQSSNKIKELIYNGNFYFSQADNLENIEHQDYLGNRDRPRTAVTRKQTTAPQFDEDATDLLPD